MLVLKLGKLGHGESSAGKGVCTSLALDFDAGTKVVEGRRKEMTPQNSYVFSMYILWHVPSSKQCTHIYTYYNKKV